MSTTLYIPIIQSPIWITSLIFLQRFLFYFCKSQISCKCNSLTIRRQPIWTICGNVHFAASVFILWRNKESLHSKNTILGVFWGLVDGGCRDRETYNFSCVCWINDTVVPESGGGVVAASFFLVCLHHLGLECFFFFLWPLQIGIQTYHPMFQVFPSQNQAFCLSETPTKSFTWIPCFFFLLLSIWERTPAAWMIQSEHENLQACFQQQI